MWYPIRIADETIYNIAFSNVVISNPNDQAAYITNSVGPYRISFTDCSSTGTAASPAFLEEGTATAVAQVRCSWD
jgi:hypothetical protein